ncbi:glycosyltransferase [Paenibacillus sp. P96]|uniref:Glycosyltransferase n=1 Tax=Paenibacillus zeirhizosphaerae TaxID=2987519 RepID=A0ABT9FXF6_9BACL|nr:glycosyltransferase [Paenibacillus sp. P96]MDP4099411.1 glycosyltransferase [Paenibacillus sp. P96]
MNRLSLCMVATGSDAQLRRCLESAYGLVDEMIIVNMEPTERIPKLAQSYDAKVFDFYDEGSYQEAGNFALSQATGDWVLWMHEDEQLDEIDRYRVRDLLYQNQYDLIFLNVLQYGMTGNGRIRILDMAAPRLFRRHFRFQYFTEYQELLNYNQLKGKTRDQERVGIFPVKIHDHRLEKNPLKNKTNVLRELDHLSRQSLTLGIRGQWYAYHLACEYYRLQMYRPGFNQLNIAVQHYLDEKLLPPYIVYKLKYSVVLDEVSSEEIEHGLKLALRMYPDYVDLQFYSGIVHYKKKMYEEALHHFNRCLELGEPSFGKYLIRKGAGSYQAAYYKGLCLDKLEQDDASLGAFVESLSYLSTFKPPLEALIRRLGEDATFHELTYFWNDKLPMDRGELQALMAAHLHETGRMKQYG